MKQSTLLDLVDSDSDDGFGARVSVPKIAEKMAAARNPNPRGRASANRVQKAESKSVTRRDGAKKAAAAEKEIERQALADSVSNERPKGTRGRKIKQPIEEGDEDAEDVLATPPGSDEPVRKKGARDAVIPDSVQKKEASAGAKRGRKATKAEESQMAEQESSEIPETQEAHDLMDVDGEEEDRVEDLPTFSRFSAPPSAHRKASYHMPTSASKRAHSSSEHENDPSIRRRLGEMTKKYEALEARYKDLKNVAVTEAEKTFDRLKRTSEEKAQTSNNLISSLRNELTAQRQLAKEGYKSQQQFEASEAKVDSLQSQVTEMTHSLAEARTQIKTLTTKLNAARAAEATSSAQAQVATARVPGSAMKPGALGARGLDAAQVQATQTAKMKENLYSDLSGLVITSVKRDGPEDVYNCIQTGRNGTLHFKLAIANENSDENLDEAEFMYKPQLDERRDSQLIEILPDFLVEEITFPRPHAAKFYARVLKSLTEKLEE
ncbi:hypothetical protein N0V93_007355 [Gnomoniopsis smithogilvyi]|uniref:Monopolin complex subunit Csm1/Pcs1 C-terminal domain-containing protein n=1 Tax=Gnomoniopsis smithogilvyi TaxID=1191159 RepID=A0A9W9CVB0_9PEZI|nr:hypothetical protein N0V93_007355 [Gnomoniopsis smithogilvyi]